MQDDKEKQVNSEMVKRMKSETIMCEILLYILDPNYIMVMWNKNINFTFSHLSQTKADVNDLNSNSNKN